MFSQRHAERHVSRDNTLNIYEMVQVECYKVACISNIVAFTGNFVSFDFVACYNVACVDAALLTT